MPKFSIVTKDTDIIYLYDGSLQGFLCCVHESVYTKELPQNIENETTYQPSIYNTKTIQTNETKATKVRDSIQKNISKQVATIIEHVLLCHHPNKEIKLLRFILKAYEKGQKIVDMTGDKTVSQVLAMEKHLLGENHLLSGFARFKDYGNILGAVISPKNFVLPLLARHFVERMPNENFMIYDNVHKALLTYQDKKLDLVLVEDISFAKETYEEQHYQSLWKHFYNTIGIKERLNPKCRMRNMPKRYWGNMVEMTDLA